MANVYLQDSTLSAIGDAIRSKGGTSDLLLPSAMPAAINALTADGSSTSSGVTLDNVHYKMGTTTNTSSTLIFSTWTDVFTIDQIKNDKILWFWINTSPSSYIYNFIWTPLSSYCYWEQDDDTSINLFRYARTHRTGAAGSVTAYWTNSTTYAGYYLNLVEGTGIYLRNASGTAQSLSASSSGVRVVYGIVYIN